MASGFWRAWPRGFSRFCVLDHDSYMCIRVPGPEFTSHCSQASPDRPPCGGLQRTRVGLGVRDWGTLGI